MRFIERGLLALSTSPVSLRSRCLCRFTSCGADAACRAQVFDVVVYACIIVGSIFLAMETPAEEIPGPLPRSISDFSGYLFTGVFLLEAMAKIAAFGFFMPKDVEYEAYWQVSCLPCNFCSQQLHQRLQRGVRLVVCVLLLAATSSGVGVFVTTLLSGRTGGTGWISSCSCSRSRI